MERVSLATSLAESDSVILNELHEYYSNEIVPRTAAAGVPMAHDFRSDDSSIPFPATFINDFGAALNRKSPGLTIALYSEFPFPWSRGRRLSDFQAEALAFLRDNPDKAYSRVINEGGREVIRLARALVMAESCVDCHNRYDTNRAEPWRAGDFRGVREVGIPLASGPSGDARAYALAAILSIFAAGIGVLAVWPAVARLNQSLARSESLARELEHMATHDALTGLPSLRLARDRLDVALAQARRSGGLAAVMLVDLDGFKQVNDTMGHEVGDAVLREASQRMLTCVRESDTVARIGGDEFLVILPNLGESHLSDQAASRIVSALGRPIDVAGGASARIGASVGIALYPESAGDAEGLLKVADSCMYEIKKSGKNGFRRAGQGRREGPERRAFF